MLRFLVAELGFSAFVMESGFAEGLAVNEWVLGGAGDSAQIATTGVSYGFGACAEMRAQLQWMRDWNARHANMVRFYGMDAPGSFATPRSAVDACLARLAPHAEDAALRILADLGERFQAHARYQAMTLGDRRRRRAQRAHPARVLANRRPGTGQDPCSRAGR